SRLPWDSRTELACALHIAAHLLDERLDRLEPPLAPQPLGELDPQHAPVEIDLAVEHVGLDEHCAPGSERRPDADADDRAVAVGARDVDAVSGAYERFVRDDVGGREPQLAPPTIARDDLAPQLERRPEHPRGQLDVARLDE